MPLTKDVIRRAVLIAHAHDVGFVELVGMAELDRATAFRGGCLRRTDLRGQDLSGFDFTDADFNKADVSGADLRCATGLTETMFRTAMYDAATQWPSNIRAVMQARVGGTRRFWPDGNPPTWADDWGIDNFGRWVTFSVPAPHGMRVTQRMRWIPPGRFVIGSPDGKGSEPEEPGRSEHESPQQIVTIADGFWLFDTPCTQELWQAVMGGNPSRFESRTRPVERVSFRDVGLFTQEINSRLPGLDLSLPTEARWEYACRADTKDAVYTGPIEINRDGTATAMDAIAWYSGNCALLITAIVNNDIGLRRGTHPVAQKAPNSWGLYDMLGNVWEWCADCWHGSYEGIARDGSAKERDAALRVARGGAWLDSAHRVRAASRRGDPPQYRGDDVGFRCARIQDSERRPRERRAERPRQGERNDTAARTGPKRMADGNAIEVKRTQIVSALANQIGTMLIRRRGAYFSNATDDLRVICTISKRHPDRSDLYWFRYDTAWHEFLTACGGYLLLGCMGLPYAFAIPFNEMLPLLDKLHTTSIGDRVDFWHLNIIEPVPGSYALALPRSEPLSLNPYRIPPE